MQVFAAARDGNVALVEKCVAACANVDGNRDEVSDRPCCLIPAL